jgi:hypothetical protein
MSKTLEQDAVPQFAELLNLYDDVETQIADLKQRLDDLSEQRKLLRDRLRDEVTNMGLGKGTTLDVPGVGTFHFTTRREYNVPREYREQFVKALIQRGEESLLTIGKADLKAWCDDMERTKETIPSYITYYEDQFVPSISLESSKARRRDKAAEKLRG